MIQLAENQKTAVCQLKNGSILCGGVGSGKSRTALAYYLKSCGGLTSDWDVKKMQEPRDLYIITTAKKRDDLEWEEECAPFVLFRDRENSVSGVSVTVDSWNNISKYTNVCGAFFIFDEQRVVGSGKWTKSFLQITKKNKWILASATPGDTWKDYIPVFVANGFYKNRTEFLRQHAVYSRYTKYPKIDRYIETKRLVNFRERILVIMSSVRDAVRIDEQILVDYDKQLYSVVQKRWNPYEELPIRDVAQFCYLARRVVNSSDGRKEVLARLVRENYRVIIFYNFDYELEIIREIADEVGVYRAEWNGHKHMPIPKDGGWVYIVQYAAAEGWNCISTNVIIFYSQSYSYKAMVQAAGRIDRMNTPFKELYYYSLVSDSEIDKRIRKALRSKRDFNEKEDFSDF